MKRIKLLKCQRLMQLWFQNMSGEATAIYKKKITDEEN
jgi:hypothetical protein